MAIGASARDIIRMFLRETTGVLVAGIVAATLITAASLAAAWWPAHRAAGQNPARALQEP